MITTIVQFKLPDPVSRSKAQELFLGSAPKYLEAAGLVRKYYLLSDEGTTAGGIYLWETRQAAESMFNTEWRQFISDKYGAEPRVEYFETPVIVDNLAGAITQD
jgi:hypothetical protein